MGCWGASGAAAAKNGWLVVSLRTTMATAELRELGCCCGEEQRPEKAKQGRGMARADAGGVKAAPRRVVACADRVLATRGHRQGHAAAMLCAGRPLYIRDSVDSDEQRDV